MSGSGEPKVIPKVYAPPRPLTDFSTDETVENLRVIIRKLSNHFEVDCSQVKMTKVPFFNLNTFMLLRHPTCSICTVAAESGRLWRQMNTDQKRPYFTLAKVVRKTGIRK